MGPVREALFVAVVFLLLARGAFGNVYSITTENNYVYQHASFWVNGVDYIAFKVKACNDAHVLLLRDASDEESDHYEIVIGGWGNGQSVIRKAKQGPNLDAISHSPLSCSELRPFWISWSDSTIRVGSGLVPGSGEFLTYQDPNPTEVNSWAVATGWGAAGSSCNIQGDPHIFTTSGLRYMVTVPGMYEIISNNYLHVTSEFISCVHNQTTCFGSTYIDVAASGTWYELVRTKKLYIGGTSYSAPQYSDSSVKIVTNQAGRWKYMVETRYGATIYWTGTKALRIVLAMSYSGNVMGLCGTFTDVKANDLTLRDGTVTQDRDAFIQDWLAGP